MPKLEIKEIDCQYNSTIKPCIFARYITKFEPIAGVIKYAPNVLVLSKKFKLLHQQKINYHFNNKL